MSPKSITMNVISANTAQKMKSSIKDFFSKCDQIHSFLRIANVQFYLSKLRQNLH